MSISETDIEEIKKEADAMTHEAWVPLIQKYFENDPVAAAHSLETIDEADTLEILKTIPVKMAVEMVRHLNDNFAAGLLQKLPYPLFKAIMEGLESQQAASIFFHFPEQMRYLLLHQLDEKDKKDIQEILTYPENSAGRLMTTDFLSFHGDIRVKDAIRKIREMVQTGAPASYAYVVDKDKKLVGVMNMRDVIVADENAQLMDVMRKELFTIDSFMDREQISKELSARRYFAAPVVDAEHRLLGVVKADMLLDGVQVDATEDIQKMFGAGGDERAFSPVFFSLKKRLPWLHVNLLTAFLAASVIAVFEDIIAKITILAVYLPVVAGQGGNAGAQSLAVVMRGLVMREIPKHKAKKMILKESFIGLMGGLVVGLVTALITALWQGNPYLGLVIGLAMIANLVVAGFSGAAIPLLMKRVGLDPAQCSNIILTTVTDIIGFFSFLGFAVIFQDFLI